MYDWDFHWNIIELNPQLFKLKVLKVLFRGYRSSFYGTNLVGGLEHEWIICPFSWDFHHPN